MASLEDVENWREVTDLDYDDFMEFNLKMSNTMGSETQHLGSVHEGDEADTNNITGNEPGDVNLGDTNDEVQPGSGETEVDPVTADDLSLDPNLMSIDAHKQWRDLVSQPVQNSQPQDKQMLKIQKQRLGYAVLYGAGPFSVFHLFSVNYLIPRHVDLGTSAAIATMFEAGDKFDWQNPLKGKINIAGLPMDMTQAIQRANPQDLNADLPIPLRTCEHSEDILDVLTKLWLQTDPATGLYLPQEAVESLKRQVAQWREGAPKLWVYQGKQRLAAAAMIQKKIEVVRLDMVKHGRAGEQDKYEELKLELDSMIR
ncbi:hypothetical protein FRC07_006809 [Ceratobasidium sp. 392]|nr:hypothetical protein FRC07_006809 [Ceratobasidium sp. 392]